MSYIIHPITDQYLPINIADQYCRSILPINITDQYLQGVKIVCALMLADVAVTTFLNIGVTVNVELRLLN